MALFLIRSMTAGRSEKQIKLNLKEQGAFLTRMGEMIENGFTLTESIDFLRQFHHDKHAFFQSMIIDLQKGLPIHEVFYDHGFDQQACVQLYFADQHGYLAQSLLGAGAQVERKTAERADLAKLIQYPLLLIIIVLVVGVMLKTILLPRFQQLYDSMNYSPEGGLLFLLHLLDHFPAYAMIVSLTLASTCLFVYRFLRKKTAIEKADLFSAIPFYSTYYKLIQTTFITREWSYLLKSGFSLNELIAIMEKQNFRPLLRESAEEMKQMLLYGYSFSDSLMNLKFIEKEMAAIVAHGEKNGRLDVELLYYSQFCLQRLEEKTTRIFQLLQPIIFAVVGILIISIYLSILMPMFQLLESM